MQNNLSRFEFGVIIIIFIIIGLKIGKYIKTLNPLNQCWTQYYLLLFVSIIVIYNYWSRWKSCKCKDK